MTQFTYDGLGRRIRISETTNNSTTTKSFLWCDAELCEERGSGGGTVNRRFFGQGEQISGTNYVFTQDHLGSVREMINSGGTIQARYEFDPYGRRTKVSGSSEADFGYTGHYYHQKSGLSLAPYREYDPEVGRWLQRDPFKEHDGLNLYTYVHNDPINSFDPLGLSTSSALRAFGLGLAGAVVGAGVIAGLVVVATVGSGFITAAAAVAAVGLVAYGGYQFGKTLFEIAMREEAYTGRTLCWDEWGDRLAGVSGGLAGGGLLGKAFGLARGSAEKGPTKIDKAVNAIEEFLGGQGRIIKNADGDTILMRGDKKIRFDIKDPHGDKPHFHLEQQNPSGKWKDAGPDHRYYFKEK